MRDDEAMEQSAPRRRLPALLRRADQAAAMSLVAVSLLAMAGYWLYHGGQHGDVIDLDTAPRRELEFRLDVNHAGTAELALLPNIGKVLAQRIVDYRQQHGPFPDHDALRAVRGVGPKTLARIKPYLLPIASDDVADSTADSTAESRAATEDFAQE
ncbi:MAG: helix-hairpin-helix domain-containing protein [Pirellulaceae bacterium]